MVNNAGSFCQDCKDKTIEKMHATLAKKREESKGICKYCGDVDKHLQNYKWPADTVCPRCTAWVDRALKLVRYSGAAHYYINRIEEKESAARDARIKAKEDQKKAELIKQQEPSKQYDLPLKNDASPVQDARIDRIEMMMMKMIQELGVKI